MAPMKAPMNPRMYVVGSACNAFIFSLIEY
jgi:hypothetical protein